MTGGCGGITPDPNPAETITEAIRDGEYRCLMYGEKGSPNGNDVLAALAAAGFAVVRVPSVAYKGPNDTDASAFLMVAERLDRNYPAGGSNVRHAVSTLLRRVAASLSVGGLPVGEEAQK